MTGTISGQGPLMPRLAAVVLAAGESRRMGGNNKLLLPVAGVPMLTRTLRAYREAGLAEVVVVTGHDRRRVEPLAAAGGLSTVHNPRHAEGQMTSVHAGLQALEAPCEGVLIGLGDQPLLTAADLRALARAFAGRGDRSILVPVHRGRRGNPIVLSAADRETILWSEPRLGCRRLVERRPDLVATVEMKTDAVVWDIDTPEDYRAARERVGAEMPA